jgi:MFS family permease
MGSLALVLGAPVVVHLAVVAALLAVVPLVVRRLLLPGPDGADRPAVPPSHAGGRVPSAVGRPGRRHLLPALAALGTIAACAQSVEDVGAAWSALYLRQDLGAAAAVGGLGFSALQTCQTVGRLVGDPLVTRFGDRAVARVGAALGGCAMAAALATSSPLATVVGFGIIGLGIGTLIPASMRQADELPGLPPGTGLTIVGTIDRIAILVAPPVIGAVADAAGLRVGLLAMPLAMAVVVVLAGALPKRVRPVAA